MVKRGESIVSFLLRGIKNVLFDGVAIIVPLAITVLVLVWVFRLVDNVLQPVIVAVYGQPITGLGFFVLLELLLLAGVMVNSTIGSRFLQAMDSLYARIPIFSTIYFAVKPVTEVIMGTGINKGAFRRVVYIEWPIKGQRSIAFVTKELTDPKGRRLYSIYVPTSPTPQSGYYMIAHEEQVIQTNISIDEAMKMVISAGIISPGAADTDTPPSGGTEKGGAKAGPKKRQPRKLHNDIH
jgi:uncharacterized membrane protein